MSRNSDPFGIEPAAKHLTKFVLLNLLDRKRHVAESICKNFWIIGCVSNEARPASKRAVVGPFVLKVDADKSVRREVISKQWIAFTTSTASV